MTPQEPPRQLPLDGRVALVAGATRGAGRGIARALAEADATVYCTGRSVPGRPSPYGRLAREYSVRTATDLEIDWLTTLAGRARKFRTKIPAPQGDAP
jgi:NAD(P)-dependent dehydrogenase (short-subunit alcohol dehydrogenase family)